MAQTDEYELTRDGWVYQVHVTYEWAHFPNDEEGCPRVPTGAPMIEVTRVEVWGKYPEGFTSIACDVEYQEPYPTLEMTEQEIVDFDEHLTDEAAGQAESRLDR